DKRATKGSSAAAKWADRIEKRAQNYDRQEAIQALSDMATQQAAEALLRRFTFHIDPSITDQEEKDSAFKGILRAGKEAIDPVRAQDDAASAPALAKALAGEESVRVRTKIAEGLFARGWEVPGDQRNACAPALPAGYTIDAKGRVIKR